MDRSALCNALRTRRDGRGLLRIHFVATFTESVDCQVLLEHGADVEQTKDNGWTALHLAVRYSDAEMIAVGNALTSLIRLQNLSTVRSSSRTERTSNRPTTMDGLLYI